MNGNINELSLCGALCIVLYVGLRFAQGVRLLFRRCAGRGPRPPEMRRIKTGVVRRGTKEERALVTKWPLRLCYRGVVCHGAKWQRWKKANPGGSVKGFFRLRARRVAKVFEEIRSFWALRGAAGHLEGVVPPPDLREISSSRSSGEPDECAAEREYLRFMATGPSDEELLAWVLRSEPEEFAPSGYSDYP